MSRSMRLLLSLLLSLLFISVPVFAQTAGDPNEGSRLSYDPANSMYTLSWWGRSGKSYFVQHSEDLLMWGYYPVVIPGLNAPAEMHLQTTSACYFLRLEIEDDPYNTDSDGDGIPDGWDVRYGLNPHDPNDTFSMAAGGLTYLQKYQQGLDPTKDDTDGDGVIDSLDLYPNDPRRSEPIPAKFYAVTDLSSYLPGDVKATFNATQVALDDSHNVAFFGRSDATSGGGKTGHVYKWNNGALTEPTPFAMEYPSASGSDYWATMSTPDQWIFGELGSPSPGLAHSELAMNGINATGTLAATTGTDYYSSFDNGSTIGHGSLSKVTVWPLTSYPTPPGPVRLYSNDPQAGSYAIAVDNAGHTLGSESVFTSDYPTDPFYKYVGTYSFHTLFDGAVVPALSQGSPLFSLPIPVGFATYGLNGHGAFLAQWWEYAAGNWRKKFKYCQAPGGGGTGTVYNAPQDIWQINDKHQAIGGAYHTGTDSGYWFGIETAPGAWDTFPLLELLKWTHKPDGTRDDWDKFHGALANVVPRLITDADPASAGMVAGGKTFANGAPSTIVFTASFADDAPDGGTTTNTWTDGSFVLELDKSSPNVADDPPTHRGHHQWHDREQYGVVGNVLHPA